MTAKIFTARKDYKCVLCESEIKKGEKYVRSVEPSGFGLQTTWILCISCGKRKVGN